MLVTSHTNSLTMTALRAFSGVNNKGLKTVESLSTGKKINNASDDAAGLSISERYVSISRGTERARINNVELGSAVQNAESGLSKIMDEIHRIKELAIQAANGINSEEELSAIQKEVNERVTNIQDFSKATTYNGIQLLNHASDLTMQLGADQGETFVLALGTGVDRGINIDISVTTGGSIAEHSTVSLENFNVGSTTVASKGGAVGSSGTLDDINQMVSNISRMRAFIGSAQNYADSKLESTLIAQENSEAAFSRIRDVDFAKATSELAKYQLLEQTATAMLSQANLVGKDVTSLLPGL